MVRGRGKGGEGDGGVSRFGMAGGEEGGSWEIPLGRAFATTDKNLQSAQRMVF